MTESTSIDGSVSFAADGTPYEAGLSTPAQTVFAHRGFPEGRAGLALTSPTTFLNPDADKPWLTIDPRTGALYVAYVGRASESQLQSSQLLQRPADGGKTWAAPTRLNASPIDGKGAVQIPSGRSWLGEYVGIASTDQYAYALWIATDGQGTQADMVRIQR